MTLKRLCPKCNAIINAGEQYCNDCQKKIDAMRKQRHKEYKTKRTDDREQAFYKSREWKALRQRLDVIYKGLCIYSYYEDHRIIPRNLYHHIVPVKEDWSKRLDIDNLIPVSNRAHQKIHKLYESGQKEETQRKLLEFIRRFRGVGG